MSSMIENVVILLCTLAMAMVAIAQPPGPPKPGGSGVICAAVKTTPMVKFTVDTPSNSLRLQTTQCPPYDWTSQTTPNEAEKACITYQFPYPPRINSNGPLYTGVWTNKAKTIVNTNPIGGAVGLAVNGVAIFGNADAEDRDAFVYESSTFDTCMGHPQQDGVYHYHCEPTAGCVFNDTAGSHSPLFGVMADGIPIYGSLGDNGTIPSDLDECSGHVDNTHPFYHYHTPNKTNGQHTYPYTINCLKGCILPNTIMGANSTCGSSSAASYDYSSFAATLVAYSNANYACSLNTTNSTKSSLSSSSSSTGITFSGAMTTATRSAVWMAVVVMMTLLVTFLRV